MLNDGLTSRKLNFTDRLPHKDTCDAIIIAVNTPSMKNGGADLQQIYQAMEQIMMSDITADLLIMKSTVPPGTGEQIIKKYLNGKSLTYVANPEFLRTGFGIQDWFYPARIVIGAKNQETFTKMRKLYADINTTVIETDITTAEMIKYASNAFLATKISFINEIANLCERTGASIQDVIKGIGSDPRIGTSYLQPGIGYGGPCLTKDTKALLSLSSNIGYKFLLLKSVTDVNSKQPLLVIEKVKKNLGTIKGMNIALLGLAFKPDTDDITESPAISIANILLKEGAKLRVYDPLAMENAKQILPPTVNFAKDIYSATEGTNAIIMTIGCPEFIIADWKIIRNKMAKPYAILDGPRVLPRLKLIAIGFKYVNTT